MKTTLLNALRWFGHGIRILIAGFGAYLIVALAIGIPLKLLDSSNPVLLGLGLICALICVPIGIALFGYLFTKCYTYTTWGHQAAQDMKSREGCDRDGFTPPTLMPPSSIKCRSRGAPTGP